MQVLDGPYVGELYDDVIMLGMPDGNKPGYRATITKQPGLKTHLNEAWTVHVLISLTTGNSEVKPLRDHGAQILTNLDAALRDHPTLDGVWQRATINGDIDWIPTLGASGAAMTILFDIEGESLL